MIGDPDAYRYAKAFVTLVGAEYGLSQASFGYVKQLPEWPPPPEETLALELQPSLRLLDIPTAIRQYPLVTTIKTLTEDQKPKLLHVLHQALQTNPPRFQPLSLQILFKPTRPGSTRIRKPKQETGKEWMEDAHKIAREQAVIADRVAGKKFGYWKVTVRVLCPQDSVHLLAQLNTVFDFHLVKATKAIRKFHELAFGKTVSVSSVVFSHLFHVPTGSLFSRKMLKASTVQWSQGRLQRTDPFPDTGYFLGTDDHGKPIYLTNEMLRQHLFVGGITGQRKSSMLRALVPEFLQEASNRVLVIDRAGEYTNFLHEGFTLLRPGSAEFPLGINFLDWGQTLGLDKYLVVGWILKILHKLVREKGEFTPKMAGMLRQAILRLLEKGGTLFDLFTSLDSLHTKLRATKIELKAKANKYEALTPEEQDFLRDYETYSLTVEALRNRLADLYESPLRQVFYVDRTTVTPEELLSTHVIIDLHYLEQQQVSKELIQVVVEFLLLFLFQAVVTRRKGHFSIRNIIIIEEAHLITPELFKKSTSVDMTTPEEFLGTMGGFGLSFLFVTAQPERLSQGIIAGCHTKLGFGATLGLGGELMAKLFGVEPSELSIPTPGTALLTSKGCGTIKVQTQTKPIISPDHQTWLEAQHRTHPTPLLQRSRELYRVIAQEPRRMYAEAMDIIEATQARKVQEEFEAEEEGAGQEPRLEPVQEGEPEFCWFFTDCGVCKRSGKILFDASDLEEKYWNKKKKAELQTRLDYYPANPQILFTEILELTEKQNVPAPELTAFCAHQLLLKRCRNNSTIAEKCPAFSKMLPEEIARRFVESEGIQEILDLRDFYDAPTTFSHKTKLCALCPLDHSLHTDFCEKYRQETLSELKDPTQAKDLKTAYEVGFDYYLTRLLEITENPSFAFCLTTTMLRKIHVTTEQKEILQEKLMNFLAKWEQSRPDEVTRLREAATDVQRLIAEDMLHLALQDLPLKKAHHFAHLLGRDGGKAWLNAIHILDAAVALEEQGKIPANFKVSTLPDMVGELHRWPWWLYPDHRAHYLQLLSQVNPDWEAEGFTGNLVPKREEALQTGELKSTLPPEPTSSKRDQIQTVIENLFTHHDGIVARAKFKQHLQARDCWMLKPFYAILEQIGVKKFRVAIQKRGEDPRRVKAETYYISPAFYAIQKPLDLYRVVHNFIMKAVKNYLSVSCSVKDRARLTDEGKWIISDLKVQCGTRTIYVEYTSGGCAKMESDLEKIKDSRYPTVLLVGLDQPSRRTKQALFEIKSNKVDALKIAADLGVQVRVFSLTNLIELEAFCLTGELPYTQ